MRQIKYILIDDSGQKNREHHYNIDSKGCVADSTDIRKAVKVIDRKVDPDGYNANSVVVRLVTSSKLQVRGEERDALKGLLVELRNHFPEAMIFGIREIGGYFIKVSDEMNRLRLELSDMS